MTEALVACMYYWSSSGHPSEMLQFVVLVLLLFGFMGWRRLRPKPSILMVNYVLVASSVTIFGTCAATIGNAYQSYDVFGVVLKASIALTLCVYAEIFRVLRAERIAKATATFTAR